MKAISQLLAEALCLSRINLRLCRHVFCVLRTMCSTKPTIFQFQSPERFTLTLKAPPHHFFFEWGYQLTRLTRDTLRLGNLNLIRKYRLVVI